MMTENEIGTLALKAAIEVHRELGPGLLESVYEAALAYELQEMGLHVQVQLPVPVKYKSIQFEIGFRMDLLLNELVVLELKSIEAISASHRKQIQTYLRLSDKKLGYILNFGSSVMKVGIVRAVNGLPE